MGGGPGRNQVHFSRAAEACRVVTSAAGTRRYAPPMNGLEFVDQLRRLIEIARTVDYDDAAAAGVDLAPLVASLDDVAGALDPHVVHGELRTQAVLHLAELAERADTVAEGSLPDVSGDLPEEIFRYSPVIGPLNPIAPPFRFWFEDGVVHGEGRFTTAYNGPPAGTHGGLVAAAMDELLGLTGVMTGNHGFTGTLSIRYERLSPLNEDLTMQARVERTEGRKTFITGEIMHDGQVTARAEGIFITPAGF